LKLQYEEPLSNFAFNSNLRRYTQVKGSLGFCCVGYGLPDVARHHIQRISNPRVLNYLTPYDVAINICPAL
jgi:hypothetical protein